MFNSIVKSALKHSFVLSNHVLDNDQLKTYLLAPTHTVDTDLIRNDMLKFVVPAVMRPTMSTLFRKSFNASLAFVKACSLQEQET